MTDESKIECGCDNPELTDEMSAQFAAQAERADKREQEVRHDD